MAGELHWLLLGFATIQIRMTFAPSGVRTVGECDDTYDLTHSISPGEINSMFHTSKHICRSSSMGTIAALAWYVYGHLKCIRCSSFSLYDGVKGLYSAYQHRVDVDNHRPFIFLMEMTVIEQPEDVLVRCHGLTHWQGISALRGNIAILYY